MKSEKLSDAAKCDSAGGTLKSSYFGEKREFKENQDLQEMMQNVDSLLLQAKVSSEKSRSLLQKSSDLRSYNGKDFSSSSS